MPITKRKVVDQIICEPETGTVLWRETTIIEEDGVELTRQYHRGSVEVDAPAPTNMPAQVAPFRVAVDTPQARTKAQARKNKVV